LVATYGPDHDREHEVELEAEGIITARGRGRSKKDAEQAAARAALEALDANTSSDTAANREADAVSNPAQEGES
jgi:ribonuclease-3